MGFPSERENSEDRKDREIKPYNQPGRRPPCPFYGFDATFDVLVMNDSGGDQCALKTDSYSPCQMEIVGDTPNWFVCPLNTDKNRRRLERSLEKIRVFPREFRPAKARSWRGISLEIWVRHITNMTN